MSMYPVNQNGIIIFGLPANPVIGTIAVDSADGKLKKHNGSSWIEIASGSTNYTTANLRQTQATGPAATSVAATWNIRIVNTLNDPSGLILNPGVFTGAGGTNTDIQLGAGTYYVEGEAGVFNGANKTRLRFQNTTDAVTVAFGITTTQPTVTSSTINYSTAIMGLFTIAATKTFQLQHYTQSAVALGVSAGTSGETNVFVNIKITKVS